MIFFFYQNSVTLDRANVKFISRVMVAQEKGSMLIRKFVSLRRKQFAPVCNLSHRNFSKLFVQRIIKYNVTLDARNRFYFHFIPFDVCIERIFECTCTKISE